MFTRRFVTQVPAATAAVSALIVLLAGSEGCTRQTQRTLPSRTVDDSARTVTGANEQSELPVTSEAFDRNPCIEVVSASQSPRQLTPEEWLRTPEATVMYAKLKGVWFEPPLQSVEASKADEAGAETTSHDDAAVTESSTTQQTASAAVTSNAAVTSTAPLTSVAASVPAQAAPPLAEATSSEPEAPAPASLNASVASTTPDDSTSDETVDLAYHNQVDQRDAQLQQEAVRRRFAASFGAGSGFTGIGGGDSGFTGSGGGDGFTGIGAGDGFTGLGAGDGFTGIVADHGRPGTGEMPASAARSAEASVLVVVPVPVPWVLRLPRGRY